MGNALICRKDRYQDGYNDGVASVDPMSYYDDGYNNGYSSGYNDGHAEGYVSGQDVGYFSGYDNGKKDGINDSFLESYEDDYWISPKEGIVNILGHSINFNYIGHVPTEYGPFGNDPKIAVIKDEDKLIIAVYHHTYDGDEGEKAECAVKTYTIVPG